MVAERVEDWRQSSGSRAGAGRQESCHPGKCLESVRREPAIKGRGGRAVAHPDAQVVVGTDLPGTTVLLKMQEKDRVRKGGSLAELRSRIEHGGGEE